MPLCSLFLTGEQIRAGRAFARIEQSELARRSHLSLETIKRLERIRGPVDANVRTLAAITEAFELAGIEFDFDTASVGVRFADPEATNRGSCSIGRPQQRAQPIHRIIYHSKADQITPDMVANIEHVSATRNRSLGVTGVLLVCDGRFMQVLEGQKAAVRQIYGAISADPRHRSLSLIQSGEVGRRHFSDWSTCVGMLPSHDKRFSSEPWRTGSFRPEFLSADSALDLLSVHRDLRREDDETFRFGGGEHRQVGPHLAAELGGPASGDRSTAQPARLVHSR